MSKFVEFADVRFRVTDGVDDSPPTISTFENGPKTNQVLNHETAFLMLLYKGTTEAEAQDLVERLNELVQKISLQRH